MSGYNVNITGESEVYHIYAKDRCLYNCLNKKEFKNLWTTYRDYKGSVGDFDE